MRVYKILFTLFLVIVLTVSFSATVFSLSRDELNKFKEETLMAPDFSLKATDGKTYSLSDYKGEKIVVIQTGSSTWTPYLAQVAATQKLVKKWEGAGHPVKFFTLYNREAHLEWKAKSTEERFQRALYSEELSRIVTGEEQIVTTLVDEVIPGKPGSSPVNEAYGNTSNGVAIVDQDGKVVFFASWYRFGEVDEVLTELGKKQGWL